MSTRCCLKVIKRGQSIITLYHHHDGYIDGVGKSLIDKINNNKINGYSNTINHLLKDTEDEWELASGVHTDIEYLYCWYVDEQRLDAFYISNVDAVMAEELVIGEKYTFNFVFRDLVVNYNTALKTLEAYWQNYNDWYQNGGTKPELEELEITFSRGYVY